MRKVLVEYIKERLKQLKYKDDNITLDNVYPSLLESVLGGFNDGYEINGYDCDYWAETDEYSISGCMRYGTAEITLKIGEEKTIDENLDEIVENVYTRSSFSLDRLSITNVPPVIECDEETLEKLKDNETLKPFYIVFVNYSLKCDYVIIYAKKEHDARLRAFSIWGRKWDDIRDEKKWKETVDFHKGNIDDFYKKKENDLILKWD